MPSEVKIHALGDAAAVRRVALLSRGLLFILQVRTYRKYKTSNQSINQSIDQLMGSFSNVSPRFSPACPPLPRSVPLTNAHISRSSVITSYPTTIRTSSTPHPTMLKATDWETPSCNACSAAFAVGTPFISFSSPKTVTPTKIHWHFFLFIHYWWIRPPPLHTTSFPSR